MIRRLFPFAPLLLAMALLAPSVASAEPLTVRVGVQKYGTLIIARERHTLETAFAGQDIAFVWKEFPGGPQLLEALNAGAIDIGTTGEAPPIFALAAGAPLVYVAVEPAAPSGEAILVPDGSPIRTVADLKGKRIALNKGSNVHFLLVQALATAGLTPKDVESVFLTPADGRAAFERGAVDAWVIWDPFYAAGAEGTKARVLATGQAPDGTVIAGNRQYYLASRAFTAAHRQVLDRIVGVLGETDEWAKTHQAEVADLLAPSTGLPVPVLKVALARMGYGLGPVDDTVLTDQQRIADSFTALGLIPIKLDVRQARLP